MAKQHFIKVRVTKEEQRRFVEAIQAEGRDVSSTLRACMERIARRVEKNAAGREKPQTEDEA